MVQVVANCDEYFETLQDRLIPEAAKGVSGSFLYDIEGEGQWTVTFDDGSMKVEKGNQAEKPTVTIQMKGTDYIEMVNGDLDGRRAFMTRKLKVKGSLALAQKMRRFLPPREKN